MELYFPLILDGANGTELQKRGYDGSVCAETWVLEHPEVMQQIQKEYVEKRKWITDGEILEIVTISESTPGPIAINSATYIGHKKGGALGSALATLAVCIPSFAIIYAISLFFDRFLEFEIVSRAFRGIQVCVVYLIASAGIKLLKSSVKDAFSAVIFALTLILCVCFSLFAVGFSSIFFILISGAAGYFAFITRKRAKREKAGGEDDA